MKKLAIAALCTVFTVGAFAYENYNEAIYLDLYPSILINKKDFAGAERIVSDLKEMKLPKASADRIAPLEKRIADAKANAAK